MTFSITVHDPTTGQLAVGAVTAEPAVGKLVSHARRRAGAVASQAAMNPYLGLDGLELLEAGRAAKEALDLLLRGDPGREARQVGVVDAEGRSAAWTGSACPDWSGHLTLDHVSVQGNRLVGPQTLDATLQGYLDADGPELARRVYAALVAGEKTGADTDGALSATILVVDREEYPLWDVRVDHHDAPVQELDRLLDVFEEQLLPTVRRLSTRNDPMGSMTRTLLEPGTAS
ncbi:DUF1028 domain-containing protein [Egicoccus halophilus]|uniref:DUF1028 domain-containing protein n=1 Tax=Egicoccus halophilus TaxID=1670830 RepID=UPI001030BFCE|nr:DUF1028 domain-containing protein [Egicoccus halophilus]